MGCKMRVKEETVSMESTKDVFIVFEEKCYFGVIRQVVGTKSGKNKIKERECIVDT